MDFGLSEEQELLRQSARELLAHECTPALVREVMRPEGDGYPRALYAKLGELGWSGLLIPEAFGGLGLRLLDLAVVAEEMGRVVLPGPFFSSSVLASLALGQAPQAIKKAWWPKLAAGEVVGTVAFVEESDRLDAAGVTTRLKATRSGYRLHGTKLFVPDAAVADFFLVAARCSAEEEAGVCLVLVQRDTPGVNVAPLESIDQTRRLGEVAFDHVDLPNSAVIAGPGKGWKTMRRLLDAACVCLAADSLGGAERSLELAVEYSKTRQQFGQPIGAFQAIKHMAAEMVSEIEPARSLVWYAAHAFDHAPKEAARAAALAKARMSDVYSRVANRAVQIHGGIGFTWEHDMHLWFKRAKHNELAYGDATYHRERLARLEGW